MPLFKIEKKTQTILAVAAMVAAVVYIFTSFGKLEWIQWVSAIFGFFLAGVLYSESAIGAYLKSKGYKKISYKDFVVWVTVVVATGVVMNSLLMVEGIKNKAPEWLITFSTTTAVITGIVAALLAILHLVSQKYG